MIHISRPCVKVLKARNLCLVGKYQSGDDDYEGYTYQAGLRLQF